LNKTNYKMTSETRFIRRFIVTGRKTCINRVSTYAWAMKLSEVMVKITIK